MLLMEGFVYELYNLFCKLFQNDAVATIGLFLRKNQRALKLSTLQLLDCLIKNYHSVLYVDLLQKVTAELLPALLDESDLHIAQWTLVILKSIAEVHPSALQDINNMYILPKIMLLVKSPLLQGRCKFVYNFLCLPILKIPWNNSNRFFTLRYF